ncbi:MAG TPA: tetratricopeptide repeat protein, partial [Terriglobales bacterium]|nr:tetratricopeptide repeat protein [Terriglobales bacterium]
APLAPRVLRSELSPRLQEIILKCLEKDPECRYQSAQEMAADFRRAAVDAAEEKSLAVLYFENLSGQKEDEYFRDGITEDITTELAKIRELRVFSRSAVLVYRDKPVTPSHIGQQLNASHVLEGSLRREGERLRITAKLAETRTGHTLWAERFDRELRDVFAIQDEIAGSIARALRVVLSEGEKRAIEKVPTADVRAYDFYLRGRQFFHQFRRRGFDFARQMFARAIEIDPTYARAYAGIADCCAFLYMYWDSSGNNLDQAEAASRKALALDPDLAEARASGGLTASLRKHYEEARKEFDVALRLDPKLFEAFYYYGRSYYAQGELAKAALWFDKASQVRPEDYQAPMLLASALRGLGRNPEAELACRRGLAAAEKHLELYPGDARALYFGANGLSYFDRERALDWARRALQVEPDEPQVLYNVACVYALLGELEAAIDCLEKSLTHGWGQREWMASDPDLAPLRGHPRFQALLH